MIGQSWCQLYCTLQMRIDHGTAPKIPPLVGSWCWTAHPATLSKTGHVAIPGSIRVWLYCQPWLFVDSWRSSWIIVGQCVPSRLPDAICAAWCSPSGRKVPGPALCTGAVVQNAGYPKVFSNAEFLGGLNLGDIGIRCVAMLTMWEKISQNQSHRIHGTNGIFTDPWMVDFYGKLVGKYTVRPMVPLGMWEEVWDMEMEAEVMILRGHPNWVKSLRFFLKLVLMPIR